MKKTFLLLLINLSLVAFALAAPVTVNSFSLSDYQGGETTATLRIYADESFVASDGSIITGGSVGSSDVYKKVKCVVTAAKLTCPSVTLQSTNDGKTSSSARYSAVIYGFRGAFQINLLRNFALPSSMTPSATWAQIAAYNSTAASGTLPTTYSAAEPVEEIESNINKPDAATTAKSKKELSVSAEAASNSLAASRDAKVGGVIGSYAIASLPNSGVSAGQLARVTDSTRGLWRYDGTKWIPQDAGRKLNALDFCDAVTDTDCTSELQTAIDVLEKLDGGTIVFPAGYTFRIASTLNLNAKGNIAFEGTNTNRYESSRVNIEYTGAGALPAIDARSSQGLIFHRMHIRYTSPSFTGWLVQFGHGSTGGDAMRMEITNCVLEGTSTARNAAGLVDLNLSIIGKISDNHFLYAQKGIRGTSGTQRATFSPSDVNTALNLVTEKNHGYVTGDIFSLTTTGAPPAPLVGAASYFYIKIDDDTYKIASSLRNALTGAAIDLTTQGRGTQTITTSGYSYVFQIENNDFNYLPVCIWNPDSNFRIVGNTFEPDANNYVVAVDSDGTYFIRSITIENNYAGDASVSIQPIYRLRNALGGGFRENWGTVAYNGTVLELSGAQGFSVQSNRIETQEPPAGAGIPTSVGIYLNGAVAANYTVSLISNSLNAVTPVLRSGANPAMTDLSNESGGGTLQNAISYGLIIGGKPGTDNVGVAVTDLGLGTISGSNAYTGQTGRFGGGIRMASAFAGTQDGSMHFTVRNDALAQFVFHNDGELLRMDNSAVTVNKPFLFKVDNNDDIGAAGATRPRTGYFGTSVIAPTIAASTAITTPAITVGTGGTAVARIKHGTATLVAGKVMVADTTITENSKIFINRFTDAGTVGGSYSVTRRAGVSFTITSMNGSGTAQTLDNSIVVYQIIEP